jgi:hypothetical protein
MTISFLVTIPEETYEMTRKLTAETGKDRDEIIIEAIVNLYSDIIRKNIRERK